MNIKTIVASVAAIVTFGAIGMVATDGNNTTDTKISAEPSVLVVNPCPVGEQITKPFRPTYEDVSLKVMDDTGFAFYKGCTSTQTQMRGLEQTLLSYTAEMLRYARNLPYQCSDIQRSIDQLGQVMPRYKGSSRTVLGQFDGSTPYDDLAGDGGTPQKRLSQWTVNSGGRHYQVEQYTQRRLQSCSVNTKNRESCAQLASTNMLILLNLKVNKLSNGSSVCVKGSNQVIKEPLESVNNRDDLGVAKGKCLDAKQWNATTKLCKTVKVDAMSANDIALLHATHAAHKAVVDARCGVGPEPPTGIVSTEHMKYEATARTEEEHGFRRMQDFFGVADPLWSDADVCTLFQIADDLHGQWVNCQIALDWACSDRAGKAHHRAHYCLGYKDDRIMIRPPGEPIDHSFKALMEPRATHPNMTCSQWIVEYRLGN